MSKKTQTQGSGATAALGVGAVAVMLVCCAGPALLVGGGLAALGGALAAVGGFLSSPLTIVTGLVIAGVGLLALLRRRHTVREGSCPRPDGSDSIDPTKGNPS